MRALRHVFERRDLTALAGGSLFTLAVVLATVKAGSSLGAGAFFAIALFCVLVVAWVYMPHMVIALTIPLFALLPAAKVLATPWIGPLKDFFVLAAAGALVAEAVRRRGNSGFALVDRRLMVLVTGLIGLYVINLGGDFATENYGIAWLQGIRLISEPLILLTAGLVLGQSRRALNYAAVSIIVTGVFVALYGLLQQKLGGARLVELGYSYNQHVRMINGRLRSFGTLDDPFAYAAFLMLSLSTVFFWMRRGALAFACGGVIMLGLLVSYVRSAGVILVALIAIWLVRKQRTALGLILLGVSAVAALTLLFAQASASETRSVSAGPGIYVTLNGRTTAWKALFSDAKRVPLGLGVGKVGTAADRATYGLIKRGAAAKRSRSYAVDSGYFAAVADVGFVGFAVLLALLALLVSLAHAGTRRPGHGGWLALGYLTTIMIDAVTRESFTGFPTAFLGLLLVGLALAPTNPSKAVAGR